MHEFLSFTPMFSSLSAEFGPTLYPMDLFVFRSSSFSSLVFLPLKSSWQNSALFVVYRCPHQPSCPCSIDFSADSWHSRDIFLRNGKYYIMLFYYNTHLPGWSQKPSLHLAAKLPTSLTERCLLFRLPVPLKLLAKLLLLRYPIVSAYSIVLEIIVSEICKRNYVAYCNVSKISMNLQNVDVVWMCKSSNSISCTLCVRVKKNTIYLNLYIAFRLCIVYSFVYCVLLYY